MGPDKSGSRRDDDKPDKPRSPKEKPQARKGRDDASKKTRALDPNVEALPPDPNEPVTRPLNASKLRQQIRLRQKLDFDPLQPKKEYSGPTLAGQSLLERLDTRQPPPAPRPIPKKKPPAKEPPKEDESPHQAETRTHDPGELERTRLAAKSKSELINIIISLKGRLPEATGDLSQAEDPLAPYTAAAILAGEETTEVARFVRLPLKPARSRPDAEEITWRVVLKSANAVHKPFGLELSDDAFVGRSAAGIRPDLDLLEYGADRLGVSRQHAILRPTRSKLVVVDLGSTNGTFYNGKRLRAGEPQALKDGDTLAFAGLRFSVKVVEKPR